MYSTIFNIDFATFILQLLPSFLRRIRWHRWLLALTVPSQDLHAKFLQYRASTNYKLEHTPQVFSMENVLNDAFDPIQRRIYIQDGIYRSPVRFYDRSLNSPVRFYDAADEEPVRFFDRESLLVLDVDFIVKIPITLVLPAADLLRLQALVDFYRLPDKTFNTDYYE